MRVHHDEVERLPDADELPQLPEVLGESLVEHPKVHAWNAEAQCLFAEAEKRLIAGRILPALSSRAATPSLHPMLTERFSRLLLAATTPAPDDADLATGPEL